MSLYFGSKRVVALIHYMECCLDVRNKDAAVTNLNPKLLLDGLMHVNAGLNVDHPTLIAPVGIEGDGHTLNHSIAYVPASRVDQSQPIGHAFYYSLGGQAWLVVGLAGVVWELVASAHGEGQPS